MRRRQKKENTTRQRAMTSVILFLLAIVAITTASVAWFSIADNTRVRSMSMDVTSGYSLRFDLDAHAEFTDYVKTLSFESIQARIKSEKGFDMAEVPMEPVTTTDTEVFTFEDGTVVESDSGNYLEFTLHFMAMDDMIVHLTSANSDSGADGTNISSETSGLPEAMRISFTVDGKTYIYDPGMGGSSSTSGNVTTFGLPSSGQMVYDDSNAMFSLKALTDKPVVVHIWIEGTDEACTNELKGSDYSIRLRFAGTDPDNNVIEEEESAN